MWIFLSNFTSLEKHPNEVFEQHLKIQKRSESLNQKASRCIIPEEFGGLIRAEFYVKITFFCHQMNAWNDNRCHTSHVPPHVPSCYRCTYANIIRWIQDENMNHSCTITTEFAVLSLWFLFLRLLSPLLYLLLHMSPMSIYLFVLFICFILLF